MESGVIEKLIAYYLENEKFLEEIKRAKKEFFDSSEDGVIIAIDEECKPFFMEWLTFDFRLKNGKSLLENYYDCNPRKRPLYEMQIYRDLQDNVYGLIEIQKIYPGIGLDLLMLHTGKKYFTCEYSATFQLKKGNLFFNRIAKVNGQYELVGANIYMLPIRLDSQAKKRLINKDKKLTPKDAVEFFKKDRQAAIWERTADTDKIKVDFDELLDELGISGLVSADLVQKWLANIDFKRAGMPLVDILIGLTDHRPIGGQMDRLLNLTSDLANQSPQKALKGRSPEELAKAREFGSKGFDVSIRRIGGEWPGYANKATKYLKKFKVPEALDYFEKTFKVLLKEKTTGRSIFSVFANTGICHLYFGNEFMARKLLDISLELNRNYKFGKKILAELDSDKGTQRLALEIRFALKSARTKELKEFWKKAKNYSDAKLRRSYYEISLSDNEAEWKNYPAKKYYDFLKQLEIDFSGA